MRRKKPAIGQISETKLFWDANPTENAANVKNGNVTNVNVGSANAKNMNVANGSVDSVIVNCRRRPFMCRLRRRVTEHQCRRVPDNFRRLLRSADVKIFIEKKNSSPLDGEIFLIRNVELGIRN